MAILIDAAIVAAAMGMGPVPIQDPEALEYQVKAAYLVNFTRYVDWPDEAFSDPDEPVTLCVLGRDPFGAVLERTVAGRTSQGRPLTVRRVDGAAQARRCHVVFISYEEWQRRPDVLPAVASRGVLTVGETPEFAAAGGVIGFVAVDSTIRFAVNREASDDARLTISSRVLALATRLYGRTEDASP